METVIPYVIYLSSQKPKVVTLVPNDPGSRYKTRQLQIQVVGKSKMIKTVLLNILDVSKDMQIPPSYPGVFMGYDIGAQAKFDAKKPERQQAFLSGEHDPKDLSRIMMNFINEVLLCAVCGLPEILIVPEQKSVFGTCRACGAHTELKIQNEKFKRYVINHPPSHKGAFGGNQAGKANEPAKNYKEKAKEKEEKDELVEKEKKVKTKSTKGDDDGVVWFSDTSEEAARKRREEMLPDAAQVLIDDKKSVVDDLCKQLKETSISDLAEKIEQLKAKGTDEKVLVPALFDSLFGPNSDLLTELKNKQETLAKVVTSPATQIILLNCLENYCYKVNTAALPKVPFVIKALYDSELVEEENIVHWFEQEKAAAIPAVREQAAPIIKWLKEAEEEDEDEEDGEEEEEEDA